ncbi:hypothetical protein [Hwangdonia sp.]|uniref:hypothetical protein n=1 Tax=Hwangdonia sp. TaxID=1883432 RepID=UPI003AB3F431
MKNNILCLILITLLFVLSPNSVMATEKTPTYTAVEANEIPPEIKSMIDRINEIKSMNKSSLTRAERKELRKEVRAMKKSVRASGNGIYISSGAIIIILLLIIIL